METPFSIIDKLSVVDNKIWHLEEIKHDAKASDKEVADAARKICILNKQRNALIEEGDELLDKCIKEGKVPMFKQLKQY